MAAASASARLETSCWVATSTGPALLRMRSVPDRMAVAAAQPATAVAASSTAVTTDHRR